MPYDLVDVYVEMQDIKFALNKIYKKVFPEEFKEKEDKQNVKT